MVNRVCSDPGAGESLQVVHDEVFVRGHLLPLEVVDVHLLARAVVDAAENVDVVREVVGAVQESGVWHRAQLYELHRFQVQHHGVLCAGTVVVASKDDDLVAGDQRGRLRLDRQRELDWQNGPLIVGHVVLLDRVDAAAALVAAKDVDVRVLEDDGGHGAPALVQVCDPFPPVHVD